MAYCLYSDVGVLLSLNFNIDSKPTDSQVADIINMISSEVNMTLLSVGIAVPTSGDLFNVLKSRVMQGSAGIIATTYYGNSDSVESGQGAYFTKQYREFLAELKAKPDLFKSMYSSLLLSNPLTDGSMTDEQLDDMMIGNEWIP
jgi:hypothetical protein